MWIGFGLVIALSIGLALWSRRGHAAPDARAFFAASGQFGAVLVFLLAVGETYSVATMLGYPGGVYAHGDGFSAWFFGYILLTAPVLFFVGPAIAREEVVPWSIARRCPAAMICFLPYPVALCGGARGDWPKRLRPRKGVCWISAPGPCNLPRRQGSAWHAACAVVSLLTKQMAALGAAPCRIALCRYGRSGDLNGGGRGPTARRRHLCDVIAKT